jgi:hypothetical protein
MALALAEEVLTPVTRRMPVASEEVAMTPVMKCMLLGPAEEVSLLLKCHHFHPLLADRF